MAALVTCKYRERRYKKLALSRVGRGATVREVGVARTVERAPNSRSRTHAVVPASGRGVRGRGHWSARTRLLPRGAIALARRGGMGSDPRANELAGADDSPSRVHGGVQGHRWGLR